MKTMKFGRTALVLALAMTIILSVTGGTIAWFTDEVTSASNVIEAGNLDIAVEYKKPGMDTWTAIDANTKLFDSTKWEPGHTEVVALKIINKGNLAVKYEAGVTITNETEGTNVYGETFKLSDYLEVWNSAITESGSIGAILTDLCLDNRNYLINNTQSNKTAFGEALKQGNPTMEPHPIISAKDAAHEVVLAITMPTTVGNEANHKTGTTAPSITFGLNVTATQAVYEKDSFGNDYDADAFYGEFINVEGTDTAAVVAAINEAQDGDVVILAENTVIAGYDANKKLTIDKAITLDLNGNTLTTESGWGGIDLKGGASIKNGVINHTGNTAAIKAFQVGSIENVTINVTETAGKTKGGIVVQDADSYIGSIKNVTIKGATNGIECYRSTNNVAIGSMENVKIDATQNGIYLNGAGKIGKISNCEIKGGSHGINAYLANLWHIALDIENSKIEGVNCAVDIWDEEGAPNTGSTVVFNYDHKTTFTGTTKATLQEEITCTINGVQLTTPCDVEDFLK